MTTRNANKDPRHPIGVVSARSGIPQDLLRAWEKRYAAVVPQRGPTGRRLYSDEDIEKLRLLKRSVAAGRRISDVAGLSIDELHALADEDAAEAVPSPTRPERTRIGHEDHLETAIGALEQLDRRKLESTLADAAVELSAPALRQRVIMPLLNTIGDRWHEGTLRIVHEHLASAIVRAFVDSLGNGYKPPGAPRILLTTPSGQRHELGALLAATAAEEHGWEVIYLGPDLPAEEIASAVRQLNPRAVGLSVVYKNGNFQLQEELRKLHRYVGNDIEVFVGGRAVSALRPLLEELGFRCLEDLSEFQGELVTLGD
jgi:DNA-binding transcriptional MerR regulator/methylmalonyl-CoA mutase cobalamin-binding subunit